MPDGKTITMYDRGYPLGFVGSPERVGSVAGTPYLYNHLRFVIKFHREDSFTGSRIVGFEVEPCARRRRSKQTARCARGGRVCSCACALA